MIWSIPLEHRSWPPLMYNVSFVSSCDLLTWSHKTANLCLINQQREIIIRLE